MSMLVTMKSVFELKVEETSDSGLVATMLIDGKPFGDDCVDLAELRKSAIVSGAYDLQTCGCGTPQCAGFWEPIFVQHDGDVIRWEFDGRHHPVPIKDDDDDAKLTVVRYEFDRMQYISEIREKFAWLTKHKDRGSLGPHGFNPGILDERFPDPSLHLMPFSLEARIVVGYTSNFHQPWVWVEGDPDIYPRQLLPTGEMWSMFGHWSLMWDSRHYDLGQCISRKDSSVFVLLDDVTVSECNREVEDLSRAIHNFWGSAVSVFWERIEEISRSSVVRIQVSSFRG